MFTILNLFGKKLDKWLGPSILGRAVSLLLAIFFIALSLTYGYARFVQNEESWRALEDPRTYLEEQGKN